MQARDLLQHAYRYACSLTRSTHDAEDLVQEAWVKLMTSTGYVENKSLLFTTIRNLFIDQYRHNNLIVFDSLDETAEPVALDTPDPSYINSRELAQALGHLRHEENEALFLNIVMGYTAQEIAELTDRSRNTVLSLISRGKKKLAELLSTDQAIAKGARNKSAVTQREPQ